MEDKMMKIRTLLDQNASRYSDTVVYRDWVEMMACALHNEVLYSSEVEKAYMSIAEKYTREEIFRFVKAFAALTDLFEEEIRDWLGFEYMRQGGNAKTGQFFTPFHLSEVVASLQPPLAMEMIEEPACGSGSMILARAKYLHSKNIAYQDTMCVTAIDVDRHCVMMAYVQLSLAGIQAKVVQGNTLTGDFHSCWYTPMYMLKGCDF
ncbi:N-6 DNA methylase [uncultured Dubosiella sp.]|uniref:N-6 DNA methylase n=1 Tax=uncultured Dubosiella sp. TaxID=1937011 RepID=UPI00259ABD77|nr:N-6 DNA methylase [uncultured Dubosiella sp.]